MVRNLLGVHSQNAMDTLLWKPVLQRLVAALWVAVGLIPTAHFAHRVWQCCMSGSIASLFGPALMVAIWIGVAVAGCGLFFGRKWAIVTFSVLLPAVAFIVTGWLLMCLLEQSDVGLLVYSSLTLALAAATWIACVCSVRRKRKGVSQ